MKTSRLRANGQQGGFTLIEALLALLVMAFGMLSLSGMQLSLSRNSDVAKQRTEAMRLAQRRIDEYRSYTSIAAAGGHTIVWDSLPASATQTSVTNATYTITTAMGGVIADALRPISVTVAWTDRGNQAQSLTISSVISKSDPVDIGYVANPLPLNAPLKRPKNRNINIPIPALDLGNGQSSTQFAADYVIVYSNVTAGVVKVCNPGAANATDVQVRAAIGNTLPAGSTLVAGSCLDVTGYVVAGYIGYPTALVNTLTGMKHDVVSPNGIVRTNPFSGQAIRCLFSEATDQNSNAAIAAASGYDFKYYLCVVPLASPFLWSGTVRVGDVPTTSSYVVCRYQYSDPGLTANERNVQPYVNVSMSMDEQNYRIVAAANSVNTTSSLAGTSSPTGPCGGAPLNTTDATLGTISTGVVHQDCRSQNTARATECPAATPFP